MIEFELPQNNQNIIKVVGVGGGGGNAVNHMYSLGIKDVDFIICNTDMKALNESEIPTKVQLGPELTKGLGAGAKPEIGRDATFESLTDIEKAFGENTQMVFVTAGMGGGTGTGGAPLVAQLAKEAGALTVGIVTTPFSYEGKKRKLYAQEGIAELQKNVDTLLIISNDKVRQHFGNIAISEAFAKADDILATAAKCITDVISSRGHIIVDFADVCTVMREGGRAILGSSKANGENRAAIAVEEALNSPLLNDYSIQGAKWILLNVNSSRGDHEHTLDEMELIQAFVQEKAGEECDLILGVGYDDSLGDALSITLIATGFKENDMKDAFDSKAFIPKDKVVVQLEENTIEVINEDKTPLPKNISDKAPALGMAAIDFTPSTFEVEPESIPSISALGITANDYEEPEFGTAFIEEHIDEITLFHLDDMVDETEALVELNHEENIVVEHVQDEVQVILEKEFQIEEEPAMQEMQENNFEVNEMPIAQQDDFVFDIVDKNIEVQEPTMPNEIIAETPQTVELFNADEIAHNRIEESLQSAKQEMEQKETPFNEMRVVEKSETTMEQEYVTIKGITLARKKGSRILTDYELEQEANFELQKRAFDERAARLRSLSYDFNKQDGQSADEEEPAYIRRNKNLETHAGSGDEILSGTKVTENRNDMNSNLNTLNNFLHGNNPD